MDSLLSILLSRWVLAGSALAFMAPVVQPFAKLSIPENVSVVAYMTKDTSFRSAMAESREESNKLFIKAKTHAGSALTKTLNSI
ncbi:hypothetical protein ABIB38_004315 [Massilia sp. UYP11]|uniref:hypothetical protein n=1 Tax=Massilia sp. UYP11 TaxID=1756385 RepID=UPI003D20058D